MSCTDWFHEYRNYHRDDKGRIVKKNDHVMDCTRYLVIHGLQRAIVKPRPRQRATANRMMGSSSASDAWLGG